MNRRRRAVLAACAVAIIGTTLVIALSSGDDEDSLGRRPQAAKGPTRIVEVNSGATIVPGEGNANTRALSLRAMVTSAVVRAHIFVPGQAVPRTYRLTHVRCRLSSRRSATSRWSCVGYLRGTATRLTLTLADTGTYRATGYVTHPGDEFRAAYSLVGHL